ncbi:PREDICTED: cytosolic carboxypeptidase 2-like [Amphimedon queenslandica]|uniref:Peptidase M14 domain-containing protein n=1 Tax=Amphimedon queenslandica TaxID=400682 RepID=A0A1X7VBP0_AMPQE|nr:PREDICTED: cytosolic carboxypeptidase 2-like [Amphimedon queenslandica]|eukprot:XP_003384825.1 PREDICTED: cytosolic carboxypeptidase 2-like [Amphimedon queenslandica]
MDSSSESCGGKGQFLCLQNLFADDGESESSGDDSASDREWKEAVRAAVETEIEYQVQLRLALEGKGAAREGMKRHGEEIEESAEMHVMRGKRQQPQKDDHLRSITPEAGEEKDPTSSLENDKEIPEATSIKVPNNKHSTVEAEERVKEKEDASKVSQQRHQSIYEYVTSKYGAPTDQLQHLLKAGTYHCLSEEERVRIGIDKRVKWPVECNIALPTQTHQRIEKQSKVPLEFFEPLLGNQRPLRNYTGPRPVVYDGQNGGPIERRKEVEEEGKVEKEKRGGGERGRVGLTFESRFESGNLRQAMQVDEYEYDLVLNTDLYTEKHTQWFYFKVSGMTPNVTYTFNIINFFKKDSLYNHGMKILMYSEIDSSWQRVGYDISYRRLQSHSSPLLKQGNTYHYLSWKMEFVHDGDTVYFSHCYPYTFSSLLSFLDQLEEDTKSKKILKRQTLCETLAGNPCPLLTITDFENQEECWAQRMGVVFMARVHPGETNSSWMMHGILKYLTSDNKHAKYLRSHFVFKIIPILNPDGVIVGNYRTSLTGVDLNRIYKNPVEKLFPTVYHAKKLVQSFMEERKIALYVDLHGHSRNQNIFMYGCHTPQCDHTHFLQERVVPWLLSQISKEKFSFKSCKFAVQRCKESTGRVSLWRMGVANSFTMEASFCGTNLTRPTPLHFNQQDLIDSGRELCEMLLKMQHYLKSASYQYKVHCRIAEYYLQQLDPEEKTADSSKDHALPDLVTIAEEASVERKRRVRQQMSKCLRLFHGTSMKELERESSTSGSDSEDDDFKYKTKHKTRQVRKKHKRHQEPPPPPPPPPPVLSNHHHTNSSQLTSPSEPKPKPVKQQNKDNAVQDKEKSDKTGDEKEKETSKQINSAPPRLQRASHPLHSWRFINKYANRSNGGIPMFSEERQKERQEKARLKSQSLTTQSSNSEANKLQSVFHLTANELCSPAAVTASKGSSRATPSLPPIPFTSKSHSHFSSATWSPGTHFPMIPIETGLSRKGQNQYHNSNTEREGDSHYEVIKKLIESRRQISRPLKIQMPPHSVQPTGSVRPNKRQPHINGSVHKVPPPPLPPSLPPSLPGLPPELTQYISEVWRKHAVSHF